MPHEFDGVLLGKYKACIPLFSRSHRQLDLGKFRELLDEISAPLKDNRKSPLYSKIPLDTTHEIFLTLLLLRSQHCCENRDWAPFRMRFKLHGQVLLHFCLCNLTAVMKGKESKLVFRS